MQSFELKLSYFNGGNLRNAIPREAYAIFGVPTRFKSEFVKRYDLFAADLKAEFRFREPNFKITLNEMPEVDQVLDARTQFGLVYSLVGVPNGVIAMSFAMPGLVETSTNLASVKFEGDDRIVVTSSQRSSVESAKTYVMQMVESVFALAVAVVRMVPRLFSRWPYHSRELDHGICQKFVRNLYMAFVRVLVQRYYYLPVLGIRRPGHPHAELYVSVLFPLFQRYFRRVVRYGQVA